MKILFIITRADTVGGAQVHVRDIGSYLVKQGHQVQVITGIKGPYNQNLSEWKIPNIACESFEHKINPYKDGKTLAQLTQLIRDYEPDLVSTHSSKAGILGRIACKLTKTPCLFTAHGWAFTEGVPEPKKTIYRSLELMATPLASRILCVSQHDREIGIAAGMNPQNIFTIHNGRPDVSQELLANPSKNNPISLVMVARFDQQKDHETLLRAIEPFSEVEVNLIGDGPKLETIQQLVKTLNIKDRVNFLGFCPDVAQYLSQGSIFTLISHWEGFPRTIVEAMRSRLPVIATDVGGVREAVVDDVTGFCVPPENVKALQEKLNILITHPELREKMGQAGRKRYEQEFTFEKMFQETFKVYKTVLSEAKKEE